MSNRPYNRPPLPPRGQPVQQVAPLMIVPGESISFQGGKTPDGADMTILEIKNAAVTAWVSLTDDGLREIITKFEGVLSSRSGIVTPPQGLIAPNGTPL